MRESKAVLKGLQLYRDRASRKVHGAWGTVYVLTNHSTTMDENLYRIYTLRDLGFDPYVMVVAVPVKQAPQGVQNVKAVLQESALAGKVKFRACRGGIEITPLQDLYLA